MSPLPIVNELQFLENCIDKCWKKVFISHLKHIHYGGTQQKNVPDVAAFAVKILCNTLETVAWFTIISAFDGDNVKNK